MSRSSKDELAQEHALQIEAMWQRRHADLQATMAKFNLEALKVAIAIIRDVRVDLERIDTVSTQTQSLIEAFLESYRQIARSSGYV